LFAIEDPQDESVTLLGHAKSNVGKKQDTLTYSVEEIEVAPGIRAARINWTGHDPRSIKEILCGATG